MHLRFLPSILLALLIPLSGRSAENPPPNIVFILTDDQRHDTLGAAGNAIIQTPHLDRLAREGVRFQNAFVTTAICCVSRASILLGQYERRHGLVDFDDPLRPEQWRESYPALLRAHGYRTGFVGKFGVGDAKAVAAMQSAFDFWRGLPGQGGKTFFDPGDPSRTHATARFGEQALEFIEGCEPGRPFCLSISFNAPHARDGEKREFEPDLRDEPLYTEAQMPLPITAAPEFFTRLPRFVQRSEGRKRWEKRFSSPALREATIRDYYRLITGIDREIGRLRIKLEERGHAGNTVIIFTSDHGFFLGEHGLADKWLAYEESIRVPLIVFDPRLDAAHRGVSRRELVLNIDLAPTMLALAGLPAPERMQGQNLAPLWQEAAPANWRTSFFYEHHTLPKRIPPSEAIRTERWSYIHWLPPNPEGEELYDIIADPRQERNLASDPAHAATLAELRAERLRAAAALE